MQGQHVAGPSQLAQIWAVDLGRWRADGVMCEHPHAERGSQLADPPADASVADDPDGGPVQVADRDPLRSAQPPSRTSRVSGASRLTRCSACARTPSATARVPLPGVMTTAMPRALASSTSTRSTPTPVRASTRSRGARQGGVHDRVGAHDRPLGVGQVLGVGWATNSTVSPRTSVTRSGRRRRARRPPAGGWSPVCLLRRGQAQAPPTDQGIGWALLARMTSRGATRCSTTGRFGVAIRSSRRRAASAPIPALSGLTEVREICRSSARKVSS